MRRLVGTAWPLLLTMVLQALNGFAVAETTNWEIDAIAVVTRVVDGDTFDARPVGRVRLADINTPEAGDQGFAEATAYLTALVHRRSVFLDVDNNHETDRYGRVVAVAYVRHNETHLLNVNEALLQAGLATAANFPNDFHPLSWTLYIPHRSQPRESMHTPSVLQFVPAIIASIVPALVLALLRGVRRRRSNQIRGATQGRSRRGQTSPRTGLRPRTVQIDQGAHR